ncbi:MAG: NB-ARC domain protein [Planctomycetes bacterium]|nr:NB-ARC domain protein [Planctomycetota bacterium]
MRLFLILSVGILMSAPAAVLAQEKSKKIEPIKVVALNRKDPVTYEKDVEPIFLKKCTTCHSGSVKEGRLDMGSYEGLVKGGKRGTPIVPGKSDTSLLYKSAGRSAKPFMPPKGEEPLSPEELAIIKLWIDQGAKAPTTVRVRPKIIVGLPPANVHPVRALTVSPDKSMVAAGRGNQIHVYDAGSGKFIRSLVDPGLKMGDGKPVQAAHMSIVSAMAFSPDSKYLVSGSFQEVSFWDVKTGMLRHKITGFAHDVVALAFSPDGKLLASGGGAPTEDGEIKIFEAPTWKLIGDIKNGHSDTVYGLSFSPDSKKIATCSADKFIKVFEVPSGKFIKSFEGHTHHVLDVGWQNDGKLLASAGADSTVKVWDYEKGEQARTINAHQKQVTRLLYIGKTSQFVTCSGDQQIKFFEATNGGNIRNFGGNNDYIYAVGVSPDGAVVVAGGQEGIVRVYNGANGQLVRSLLPPGVQPPEQKK